jgi:hypothetical protein
LLTDDPQIGAYTLWGMELIRDEERKAQMLWVSAKRHRSSDLRG